MGRPAAHHDALGWNIEAVTGLCLHRLPAPVGIPVVWVICAMPPDWSTARAIQDRLVAQSNGPLRPGPDHWRQWAELVMAEAAGDTPPPIGAFVTVTDEAGWRARLASGDHALELAALATGECYGMPEMHHECRRPPTLRDLVLSPAEGVLTFQQILAELVCNYGIDADTGPLTTTLTHVACTLVDQTIRNALAIDGFEYDAFRTLGEARAAFAKRYTHWPLPVQTTGVSADALFDQTMDFFERIAENISQS